MTGWGKLAIIINCIIIALIMRIGIFKVKRRRRNACALFEKKSGSVGTLFVNFHINIITRAHEVKFSAVFASGEI